MNEFWTWFEDYAIPRLTPTDRKMDRRGTFRKIFEHLDKFKNPLIVETGCTGPVEDLPWKGAGCSTLLFDKYISLNGGILQSCDIDEGKIEKLRPLLSDNSHIHNCDSVRLLDFIAKATGPAPKLVYLDAEDLNWHLETESQVHAYNELRAIIPKLTPQTLVVVDDSPAIMDEKTDYEIRGKGGLIAKYAGELGVPLVFSEYQSGWQGFPGFRRCDDESSENIIHRARKSIEEGQWVNAYPLYKQLLVRTYNYQTSGRQRIIHGEASAFFARLAIENGRLGTAYDWYKRAIVADPRAVDYRIELITKVYIPLRTFEIARLEAERCTKIEPDSYQAWRVLGNVESVIGDAERSLAAHRKQAELSNRSPLSLLDMITVLLDTEKYDEAEAICHEIIDGNDPQSRGDATHCLAMIKARYGNHEEAIDLYKQAINDEHSFDKPLIHFHMSLSLHSIGRYKEGWQSLAKRINNKTNLALYVPMKRFTKPIFEMQPPPAIVHIHAESGDGDNICLMRYLPMLTDKGYTVRYEARDTLLKLASDSLKGVEVVAQSLDHPGGLGIKDFDYHLPVGELPYQFETDIDTVPWYGPYVKTDPGLSKLYRWLKPLGKVGIAWSSGVRDNEGLWVKRYGQLKSLSYDLLKPVIMVDPERFVSLQIGSPRQENDGMIEDVLPETPTWADTAALIENLDLVITPDTGLAHLAGAMGKPCWVMMHGYNSGWHFMCERPGALWNEKSPWYPSVRLFRQKVPGQWNGVISMISSELRQQFVNAA